jgi:DNA-binding NtrC family response regulator
MLLRVSDVADIHDQWERARRRARVATRRKPLAPLCWQTSSRFPSAKRRNPRVLIYRDMGPARNLSRALWTTSMRPDRSHSSSSIAPSPTGLLDSAMFSHEKGPFAGAIAAASAALS